MTAIPHDILREIGAHWAGHCLRYTCASLYAGWNPTVHLIITKTEIPNGHATISRMPNGAYHGECVAVQKGFAEIVEYDRGKFVSVRRSRDQCEFVAIIVDGCVCTWTRAHPGDMTPGRISDDAVGGICVLRCKEETVIQWYIAPVIPRAAALRDYTATAHEMVAQLEEHGSITALSLVAPWPHDLPQATSRPI